MMTFIEWFQENQNKIDEIVASNEYLTPEDLKEIFEEAWEEAYFEGKEAGRTEEMLSNDI